MNLPELWTKLEQEAAASGRAGILRRRLFPEAACDLFVGVEGGAAPVRMLIVRVAQSAVAGHGPLPEAKGCELAAIHLPEDPPDLMSVCLSLLDRRFSDVFTSLVLDVVGHLRGLSGDPVVVAEFAGRIERWQRFLDRNDSDGLGPEAQRGLFGELWFLKNNLISAIGVDVAVAAWKGPHRFPHDFQLPAASVEVKTTLAKQHVKVEITSDRQLDDSHVAKLALFHLSVDAGPTGLSLPDLIEDVRAELGTQPIREAFEDLLLEGGYIDAHADLYREPHYKLRAAQMFHVRDEFPRLIERDMPAGVGDLRYTIVLAACTSFAVPEPLWPKFVRGET